MPCLRKDILETLPPNTFNPSDCFMKKIYDINRADNMCYQKCLSHDNLCPLFGECSETDLDTSGLPCTDQSTAGRQLFEEGPTGPVFAAHAKYHVEKRTKIVITENVIDFWQS